MGVSSPAAPSSTPLALTPAASALEQTLRLLDCLPPPKGAGPLVKAEARRVVDALGVEDPVALPWPPALYRSPRDAPGFERNAAAHERCRHAIQAALQASPRCALLT